MKPLVVDGPRMSDIAESEEASLLKAYLRDQMERGRQILGVHLWTHSPRRFHQNRLLWDFLQELTEQGIPVAVQVSITGLGGTTVEPGIEPMEEAFQHLAAMTATGVLSAERISLRLDPIQAWQGKAGRLSNEEAIDAVLGPALNMGVGRIRVSTMVYWRYRRKIVPRAQSRGLTPALINLSAVGSRLRHWIRQGADIRSCACELGGEGVPPGACFDFPWVTGLPLEEPHRPVAPRQGCLCNVPAWALLWKVPRRSACSGGCLACYAQEHKS